MEVIDMYEEINSETNQVKRQQLLQKYGLIEPKLTRDELEDINYYETLGKVTQ